MNEDAQCPLGASLLQLLQASVDADTTNVKALSQLLNRSRPTVEAQLKLICELMHVYSPQAAAAAALRLGWLTPRPEEPAAVSEDDGEMGR